MPRREGIGLEAFHRLSDRQATHALYECCSSCFWARRVAAGRPYATVAEVLAAADAALADLGDGELAEALAGHPRIGERTSHASSRREQSGVDGADPAVLTDLAAGNAEYEARFGHVYLVHADGRPAAELLAVLRERLGHDAATERTVLREQLALINRSRVTRLLEPVDWDELSWAD